MTEERKEGQKPQNSQQKGTPNKPKFNFYWIYALTAIIVTGKQIGRAHV